MQSDTAKLFIGGISWNTNEERLKEYFSVFGEVLEVTILKDQNTGRGRGFGFVVFADPSVAERVIQEKHSIDGRMVEAKKAVPRDDQSTMIKSLNSTIQGYSGPGRTRKIFVGGLASTVTEVDFKKYFEQFGKITDVVVMYDQNTQRPRGFGFITYDSEESVDRVLLRNFHELNGKMVEVKRAVPKELSPGPSRSPISVGGGYSHSPSRINSLLLEDYAQGYPQRSIGGYGINMDGRFNSNVIGRGGFSPLSSPNYGGIANFKGTLDNGRGLNQYFVANSNRLGGGMGIDGGDIENTSFFSSGTHNLWGNGRFQYGANSLSSRGRVESPNAGIGGGAFGNNVVDWSSSFSPQGGASGSSRSANLGFGVGANSGLGGALKSANAGSNGGAFSDFYGYDAMYGDATWRSGNFERERSDLVGFGLGKEDHEVQNEISPGFVGGYSFAKTPINRGRGG